MTAPGADEQLAPGDGAGPRRAIVVGAGTMGRGIAQLLLQARFEVLLVDPSVSATSEASSWLRQLFDRLSTKGRLEAPPDELMGRLSSAAELTPGDDAQWLFEAAPEDLDLKRQLFAHAAVVAPRAVLATNTSTLSVTAIAAACARPADVIGMHFFNPPGLMRLVEVVPGLLTSTEVTLAAVALARRLGREPVVAKDSPGFIVNRLARPYYLQALRLLDTGIGVEQVDAIMRAAGFRQGPFELLDLIGLDVNLAASLGVYRAFFEEPRYRPHQLQQAMVTAGLLGRKTGRGFYHYDQAGEPERAATRPAAASGSPRRERVAEAIAVVGDNGAAAQLRELLGAAGRPASPGSSSGVIGAPPRLVLDARLAPPADEVARVLASGATLGVLTWGRSASAAAGELHAGAYPGQLLGFSLVPVAEGARPLVELMAPSPLSATDRELVAEALAGASAALEAAGVGSVVVPDGAGGVAFGIVAALANEALGAAAEELATVAELDLAMRLGVNYPIGPLAWAERIGLSDLHSALRGLHAETHESRFAPHPYLTRLAALGAEKLPEAEVADG